MHALLKGVTRRAADKAIVATAPSWFDSSWYLQQYPDVAAAAMDPWLHYSRFGCTEGRLPAHNRALAMGHALWRGAQDVMLPRLQGLLAAPDATQLEQQQARWELARWYAWRNDWHQVVSLLSPLLELKACQPESISPRLLLIEALCRLQVEPSVPLKDSIHAELSEQVLLQLQDAFPTAADTVLAKSNVLLVSQQQHKDAKRLNLLNQLWATHHLSRLRLADASLPLSLDNLAVSVPASLLKLNQPLISVIIPVYNAAHTLPTVLRSLFAQTCSSLELLLVDDASTDNSLAVINALQAECPSHIQMRVLQQASNQGAYAARNAALAVAQGEFITVHDSDDWSHPQKLEHQVLVLLNSSAQASLSYWVRATDDLLFHHWFLDHYGWVYPNISSLMFRASVVEALGFWDQVRVNADTEYRERIEAVFGADSIVEVLPGVPLSFGRADAGSLSQHSSTHLVTQFSGLRNDYMQAARGWHACVASAADLYLPQNPAQRPFVAPVLMLRDQQQSVFEPKPQDLTRVSEWFDSGWYFQRYIHLQYGLVEPFEHFWAHAAEHGFDPGPDFSSSGYLRVCPEAAEAENPLWHFLQNAQGEPLAGLHKALPIWTGKLFKQERATLMVCGHQNGPQLFGAERSLLDVLAGLDQLGFNLLVTLPEARNPEYEQDILSRCAALAVLPYGWWQQGRQPVAATVQHFSRLIEQFNVVAVHANTLVLDEPLRAARLHHIPAIVHVRELPAADEALCTTLGADYKAIIAHAAQLADVLIANSQHTKAELHKALIATQYSRLPISVVPNTVTMQPLLAVSELLQRSPTQRLRVGMLSSNLPKKGLADIEALSLLLKNSAGIELVLVGPQTDALDAMLAKQAQGQLASNLTYFGYVTAPEEVLGELDVVINLSRFQESFGRTVLEAMAAARPVVAYNWGALSELVEHGVTGFLASLGDIEAVAGYLQTLATSPTLARKLGRAGRVRAMQEFSFTTVVSALDRVYSEVNINPLSTEQF